MKIIINKKFMGIVIQLLLLLIVCLSVIINLGQAKGSIDIIEKVIRNTIIIGVICAVISIIFNVYFFKVLSRPITEMAGITMKYADGDLRDEISEDVKGYGDDIGILANAINHLQNNFLEVLWRIKDNSQSIESLKRINKAAYRHRNDLSN